MTGFLLKSIFFSKCHYNGVIMSMMVSEINSLTIVYSFVYSGADKRKHQCSASLAFVLGIHRWSVNSPQRASKAENDVIMWKIYVSSMSDRNLWDCPQCVTEICEMVSVKHTVRTDISMKVLSISDVQNWKGYYCKSAYLNTNVWILIFFFSVLHNPLGQTADRFSMDLE